jgi:hypothetical protein
MWLFLDALALVDLVREPVRTVTLSAILQVKPPISKSWMREQRRSNVASQ